MFYLLYGTDTEKSRKRLHTLIDSLVAKKPDASVTRISEETFDTHNLEELIGGQGLFESKRIVVFDNVFQHPEGKEQLCTLRKELAASPNIFFFLEGGLDKATLDKLEKVAEKAECFGERMEKGKQERAFNTFALADALGARDRKKLWVLYRRALRADIPVEEIHGVLFWQVKSILLALRSSSAREAGLNPFVFGKAARYAKGYDENSLRAISSKLIRLSHNARRGIDDFETALERFILAL